MASTILDQMARAVHAKFAEGHKPISWQVRDTLRARILAEASGNAAALPSGKTVFGLPLLVVHDLPEGVDFRLVL